MKMTMHIDHSLLSRVMKAHGLQSKTETIAYALKELDRRARLKTFARKGLGLSKTELTSSVDENYDLSALRLAEDSASYRADSSKKSHGKRRPR
jgi:hypothetical protein